ncbi:hypothetical protein NKG05_16535 [Oerskovia sp. M15]
MTQRAAPLSTTPPGSTEQAIALLADPIQHYTRRWMLAPETDQYGRDLGFETGAQFWVVGRGESSGPVPPRSPPRRSRSSRCTSCAGPGTRCLRGSATTTSRSTTVDVPPPGPSVSSPTSTRTRCRTSTCWVAESSMPPLRRSDSSSPGGVF